MKAKKIVSAVLAAALTFTLIPKISGNNIVLAAGEKDQSNTYLGVSGISNPTPGGDASSEWEGSYVYFGTYNSTPIKFRVLQKDLTAYTDTESPTLFLDSDAVLKTIIFDDNSNNWANSDLKTYLNDNSSTGFLYGFTDLEQGAITTSKGDGGLTYDSFLTYYYGAPVSVNDQVFLLDASEVMNPAYGYSSDCGWVDTDGDGDWATGSWGWHEVANREKDGTSDAWWLRSANAGYTYGAGSVYYDGDLNSDIVDIDDVGVAPALNINQESIIFSVAVAGETNAYKLTLSDSNLTIAVPDGQELDITETTVTVPYEIGGTNAGNATRASILITDADGANILLYKELGATTATSGTFDLPDGCELNGWGTDYHVYILAEDINDDKETDYASSPVELSAPVYEVKVNIMTYDTDGVTLLSATPDIGGSASVDLKIVKTDDVVNVTATPNSEYMLKCIEWGNGYADSKDITSTKKFTVGDFIPVVDVYFQREGYTVTVNSGSADVTTAAKGETVTLTAGTAPTGKEFDKWTVVSPSTLALADATKETTTFTMPAEDVEVTATYKDIPAATYTVTVNAGSADITTAVQGETVTITAGPAPIGREFDKWEVASPSSLTFADATKETTTFTMPAENVEVTATYKDLPPITYTISVNVTTYDTDGKTVITENGGTASVSATIAGSGKTITVTATPESGYTLKSITWGDGGIAADITSTKEFTIEDFDVAVDVVFQKEETVSVEPSDSGTTTAPVAAANTYTVIQGADGTWDGKSDYVIEVKSSIDDEHCIDRFKWAAVDGIELKHGENMDLAIGSTIVIIKSDYLKTLSAGTHNIVVNFTDNSVATTLTIDAASTTATSGASVPATGEMQSPLMYVGIAMIVAAAGALSAVIVRKRKEA